MRKPRRPDALANQIAGITAPAVETRPTARTAIDGLTVNQSWINGGREIEAKIDISESEIARVHALASSYFTDVEKGSIEDLFERSNDQTFHFDAGGRLVSVLVSNGHHKIKAETGRISYNGLGFIVRKEGFLPPEDLAGQRIVAERTAETRPLRRKRISYFINAGAAKFHVCLDSVEGGGRTYHQVEFEFHSGDLLACMEVVHRFVVEADLAGRPDGLRKEQMARGEDPRVRSA